MIELIMAIENESDRFFVSDIYTRYEKYIKKFIYGYLKNWDYAEDCVHDVVEKIIKNLDCFKGVDEKEQTRLVIIYSRSVAISFYRHRQVENNLIDEMPEEVEMADNCMVDYENCPEKIIMSEENRKILHDLVNGLPDIYRDVVILKYIHNMSCIDIANALSIKESAVSTRLMRAKQMLLQRGKEDLYD
ncbi:MAG: RNA polymerase sigma factor [Clostridia bacterium]|nr:RNA polymerase sigma factor [Clostridia bacterium]